jgi:hypothetical protein
MHLGLRRTLLLLAMTGAISGCVSSSRVAEYPIEWPQIVLTNHDCDVISGRYANQPIAHVREESGLLPVAQRLAFFFDWGSFELAESNVQSVDIHVEAGSTRFTANIADIDQPVPFPHSGAWHCDNGRLIREFNDARRSEHDLVRRDRQTVTLASAVDGSLVLYVSGRSTGIGLLIPYSVAGAYWSRYARVSQ